MEDDDEDINDDSFINAVMDEDDRIIVNQNMDEDEWEGNDFMDFFDSNLQYESYISQITEVLGDDSSEDENTRGGSQPGKAPNKNRDFIGANQRLMSNYFNGSNSTYDENDFERRFRMPRTIFNRIYNQIVGNSPFVQRFDALKKPGITPLVRLTACLRKLAYGDASDRDDENLEIAESTLDASFKSFNKLMKEKFGSQYLNRCPTAAEINRATTINNGRGFPGMFASWDCKHFAWKNCPVALAGQHKGKESGKTLVLEAIADPDLYIWYHFFGEAGSLNDINILNKSSIVAAILDGSFDLKIPPYTIGNCTRDWLYFLVDGIYPPYSIFINTFNHPINEREKYFATCQEACRKDIERAFGTLVQQFQILQRPLRNWLWTDIVDLLDCCIILHNMIVEERRETFLVGQFMAEGQRWKATVDNFQNNEPPENISLFVQDHELENYDLANRIAVRVARLNNRIKSAEEHHALKNDLMDELWRRRHVRTNQENNDTDNI